MTRAVDVTHARDIRAVIGASGTGKSHYVKGEIRKHKRVLVWDLEDEYGEQLHAVDLSKIPFLFNSAKSLNTVRRIRFVASGDAAVRAAQFDLFCKMAMALGDLLIVVEELRFVTQPSRAPDGWAMVCLRGRKRGLTVIGTSQRPAQIDKDFLGNCTLIKVGALEYEPDRVAVAATIGGATPDVLTQLAALSGHQSLLWNSASKKVTRA